MAGGLGGLIFMLIYVLSLRVMFDEVGRYRAGVLHLPCFDIIDLYRSGDLGHWIMSVSFEWHKGTSHRAFLQHRSSR